ncbi:MAG TPA: methyltransferase domain-containing protein [Tepidisphaeraceae bacterium]|jgi:SAM-dependent methyltransferase|nr:methyltransferase domain-containing protein [Tepidisphaeraceae bacterium]
MDSPTAHSTATRCGACGAANESVSLFCSRCTAPLAVVSLGDLTPVDRQACLAALCEVLAESMKIAPAEAPAIHDPDLWRAYLSAFWLRPETALILYAEALAIQSVGDRAGRPWLDLGCGDGIHAALYGGWRFDPAFDAFQSLDLTAADIYHHWSNEQFSVDISRAGRTAAYGVDIKQTAIDRAKALGVFGAVERADATALPLADRSVSTIFSNMLRDLGEPLPGALDECRRVLRRDGVLLISAMTPAYGRHLYFAPAARKAAGAGDIALSRQLLRLDRGRSVFCRPRLSQEDWRILLARHGLNLASVHPIVGPGIIRFWDVGLRPFSIALLKRRQAWQDAGVLLAMKSAAIDFLSRALDPLARSLCIGEPCMTLLEVSVA